MVKPRVFDIAEFIKKSDEKRTEAGIGLERVHSELLEQISIVTSDLIKRTKPQEKFSTENSKSKSMFQVTIHTLFTR